MARPVQTPAAQSAMLVFGLALFATIVNYRGAIWVKSRERQNQQEKEKLCPARLQQLYIIYAFEKIELAWHHVVDWKQSIFENQVSNQ